MVEAVHMYRNDEMTLDAAAVLGVLSRV